MLQKFALAIMTFAIHSASATETMLDMAMYQDVMFTQIASMQESPEEQPKPVCQLRVHSVTPTLDVPKVPTLGEMPSFLKRRLARRYLDRGEPVPAYLRDDVVANIEVVKQEVNNKAQ